MRKAKTKGYHRTPAQAAKFFELRRQQRERQRIRTLRAQDRVLLQVLNRVVKILQPLTSLGRSRVAAAVHELLRDA